MNKKLNEWKELVISCDSKMEEMVCDVLLDYCRRKEIEIYDDCDTSGSILAEMGMGGYDYEYVIENIKDGLKNGQECFDYLLDLALEVGDANLFINECDIKGVSLWKNIKTMLVINMKQKKSLIRAIGFGMIGLDRTPVLNDRT